MKKALGLAGGLALMAGAASGSIIGVAGQTTWLGSPPLSCMPGALAGMNANAWDEQQGIVVSNVLCDMINNPGVSPGSPGTVSGLIDSHFIHWEPIPGLQFISGQVTFAGKIRGVIFRQPLLDITDIPLGSATAYPTGNPLRGLNAASMFTVNNNVLSFNFAAPLGADMLELRVITEHIVPAPGALAMAGLGGLLAARRRRMA